MKSATGSNNRNKQIASPLLILYQLLKLVSFPLTFNRFYRNLCWKRAFRESFNWAIWQAIKVLEMQIRLKEEVFTSLLISFLTIIDYIRQKTWFSTCSLFYYLFARIFCFTFAFISLWSPKKRNTTTGKL